MFSFVVAYLETCVTFASSEPCPIQNPDIFRTQDTYGTLQYSEICHIQNFGIFSTQAYSEPCLFKDIQAYLTMIVVALIFFFFHFNLTYFSKKFIKTYVF